jgi:hypothetical protein
MRGEGGQFGKPNCGFESLSLRHLSWLPVGFMPQLTTPQIQ